MQGSFYKNKTFLQKENTSKRQLSRCNFSAVFFSFWVRLLRSVGQKKYNAYQCSIQSKIIPQQQKINKQTKNRETNPIKNVLFQSWYVAKEKFQWFFLFSYSYRFQSVSGQRVRLLTERLVVQAHPGKF